MLPTHQSAPAQADSISFDLDLPHLPEKVWRALTDPVLLAEWLLPVIDLKLEAGAVFTFQAQPQGGWDGKVNCRLLEIEPQRKLTYNWIVGGLDTIATFTLTPTATGSRLSLVHTGFRPDQKQNFNGARYGWKLMSGKLTDLLARIP
jgi:uncharacterized protein YndB with AHSA1/START domain